MKRSAVASQAIRPLLVGLALVASGCPYVSRAEIEAQLELRDDDGDGVSVSDGDCDDLDGTVYPGAEEVPYDNVDNDCVDGDIRDVDNDGHEGCLLQGGVCVEGDAPDCDDNDPALFPGAQDTPYDGVDSDCRGNHDYDLDGDGYALAGTDSGELDAYEAASGLSAERGDCVDTNTTVYPDAPGEEPYDGVDTDCDGTNDFDVDGDGFVAPADDSATARAALDRYLEGLGEPIPSDDQLDCDDAVAEVNPGEDEVWYDGVDADCDGANDYDQDGDGYEQGEDCSDDPTLDPDAALRSPEAVETLSDDIDDDCYEGADAPWGGADTTWTNPRSLRLVHVGERFTLGALLDTFESPFSLVDDAGFGLLNFDVGGGNAPSTDERLFLRDVSGDGFALLPTAADVEVGFARVSVNTMATTVFRYSLESVGPTQLLDSLPTVAGSTGVLRPTVLDLDGAWAWACGEGQFLSADQTEPLVVVARTTLPSEPLTCFTEPTLGDATVCVDSGCQTFRSDGGTLSPIAGREGYLITEAVRSGDVWTFIDDGLLLVEGATVPSEPADHAAFVADGGDVFGLLQGPDGLELLHGPDGGPFERFTVDPGVDGEVVEVAIAAADDRIFAVVRSDADDVRWATWRR